MVFPLLALAAAPAALAAQAPSSPQAAELRAMLQDCTAHSFETVVSATVDGQPRHSKLKLCGTTGQSETDWLRTLKDSAAKIAANEAMAKPMRDEMVKAITAEIAMRSALVAPPAAGGASQPYVAPPPIIRPDLRLECFSTTSVSEGPCVDFDRFTMVIVTATAPLEAGSSLRFLRDGEERALVDLGAMKRGQRQRISLPQEVCKGVNGGQLKIETLVLPKVAKAQAQVADNDGPYILHC